MLFSFLKFFQFFENCFLKLIIQKISYNVNSGIEFPSECVCTCACVCAVNENLKFLASKNI